MRRSIRQAVNRGVRVKVIMAGKSDLVVAKNAERFLYDWLLRNKVEIYEYQNNILHGKIAVCDGEWLTIGSYNVNDISAFASIELNLDIRNAEFVTGVRQTIDEIIKNDCVRVTPADFGKTRNIFTQFYRWFSFQFIHQVFHLFTFYFRRGG